MPDIDIDFLDKVMTQVKAVAKEPYFDHERGSWMTWDQGDWHVEGAYRMNLKRVIPEAAVTDNGNEACGTAMCFAGWAAELDPNVTWIDPSSAVVRTAEGKLDIETWATKRLGLTSSQAALLFDAGNSIEDLEDFVTRLKDGDDLRGDYDDTTVTIYDDVPGAVVEVHLPEGWRVVSRNALEIIE